MFLHNWIERRIEREYYSHKGTFQVLGNESSDPRVVLESKVADGSTQQENKMVIFTFGSPLSADGRMESPISSTFSILVTKAAK